MDFARISALVDFSVPGSPTRRHRRNGCPARCRVASMASRRMGMLVSPDLGLQVGMDHPDHVGEVASRDRFDEPIARVRDARGDRAAATTRAPLDRMVQVEAAESMLAEGAMESEGASRGPEFAAPVVSSRNQTRVVRGTVPFGQTFAPGRAYPGRRCGRDCAGRPGDFGGMARFRMAASSETAEGRDCGGSAGFRSARFTVARQTRRRRRHGRRLTGSCPRCVSP